MSKVALVLAVPVISIVCVQAWQHDQRPHDPIVTGEPAWSELLKSMNRMHDAMAGIPPSGNPDVDFVNLMLPHHRAAVDMAKTELLYGHDSQLRQLAQEIITDQESEVQLMQLWLTRRPCAQTPDQALALDAKKMKSPCK